MADKGSSRSRALFQEPGQLLFIAKPPKNFIKNLKSKPSLLNFQFLFSKVFQICKAKKLDQEKNIKLPQSLVLSLLHDLLDLLILELDLAIRLGQVSVPSMNTNPYNQSFYVLNMSI
jgi:hypothetical protein